MVCAKICGGMTLVSCSWNPRSKIKAKASIEHRIKGQMGHPAACMMVNKSKPSSFSENKDARLSVKAISGH